MQPIDRQDFTDTLCASLQRESIIDVGRTLNERWSPEQIAELLHDHEADVRKLAAMAIGLTGTVHHTPVLVRALHDRDLFVAKMAEYSLWSIWFRAGNAAAAGGFRAALESMDREEFEGAVKNCDLATDADPTFAEAYHQRAIALFFLNRFQEAIDSTEVATELIPAHFGALATMGHCYAAMDLMSDAARCYRNALWVNPTMHEIRRALSKLEKSMSEAAGSRQSA